MPPYPAFARFNKPYSLVMQWSGKDMNALGCVIVPVFVATLLNSLVSPRIPFTDTLLHAKNLVYFHHMTQYWCPTEATIEYMENYLEVSHCHNDVFSRFCASKSTKKVSETFQKQLTINKQEEWESDTACHNLSPAAKCCRVDEDKTQIKSGIAQHPLEESDFNFVTMHLQNHFSDHIRQFGNLSNVTSELPDYWMMDLNQVYRQSNRHEPCPYFANESLPGGVSVSRSQMKRFKTMSRRWYPFKESLYQVNDESPLTWNQDHWWLGRVVCNGARGATESHGLVFQVIFQLHRLRRSGSVLQSSQQSTIHSVQYSSNSANISSMRRASSSYGSFHWVCQVEKL